MKNFFTVRPSIKEIVKKVLVDGKKKFTRQTLEFQE